METSYLESIPDGSKIYFRPVGTVAPNAIADVDSIKLQPSGLRCAGGIVYYSDRQGPAHNFYVSIKDLIATLDMLVPGVREQLRAHIRALETPLVPIDCGGDHKLNFARPLVMGVLNVTPDSFSDGGNFIDAEKAVSHARAMIAAGADIVDVGGESTRPGAEPIVDSEELARILPVIKELAYDDVLISVDTRRAEVMKQALKAGAHIINDVSALTYDPDSLALMAAVDVPVVLMHAQGDPRTMQDKPEYENVLLDVYDYLSERVASCVDAGIDKSRLILDPGIGFGKRVVQDNLALINGLALFRTLGCPIMLGASRKRFIGAITGVEKADERVIGSVTAALKGVAEGANILRVHNVFETVEAIKMAQAFHDAVIVDGFG